MRLCDGAQQNTRLGRAGTSQIEEALLLICAVRFFQSRNKAGMLPKALGVGENRVGLKLGGEFSFSVRALTEQQRCLIV